MRLALAVASISAAAALALGGATPALAATGEPAPPVSAGTVADAPTITGAADAALPIALGGLGLAVLAGGAGYEVGRARRDQDEHPRGDDAEAVPAKAGLRRQDGERDAALDTVPPYCLWW